MTESAVQRQIIKYLESKNYYVVKVIVGNKSGIPDILFCRDGEFCAVEVKAPRRGAKVSELQKVHLQMIRDSGGKAIVADNVDLVKETFK